MDAFVLDAYPEPRERRMVLWAKTADGRAVALRESFTPRFFVRGEMGELRRLLDALPAIAGAAVEEPRFVARICGLEHEPSTLLEVPLRRYDSVHKLAQVVDRIGEHKAFELFDVDLRMSQRYFFSRGIFPFARIRISGGAFEATGDDPWAIDYPTPPLRMVRVDGAPESVPGRPASFEDRVRAVRVEDASFSGGSEADRLAWLAGEVERRDPDVIVTSGGDSFLLPYLAHRARECGVDAYKLGRESDPVVARRREKSFFTYGKIKYRPPAHVLKGRLHVDESATWEAGLLGIVDLSRVSGIPFQDLARLGAGTAVTAVQIDRAAREGRVIPWKKNMPEDFKTARSLLAADRGAYTFEPKVGVHEDVVELDFASLFPFIMTTKNLSAETILCACCREAPDAALVVPQIGYHVCSRRRGFVPRTIGPLVERRQHFKRMRKAHPDEKDRYQAICDVYKWCLVTSFGYQGYKNAKFGRIECHEAINAWGREILLTTTEIARDHGFEVLHGVVDSLWLKRTDPLADAERMSAAVSREIGIPFDYKGRFKWIVFLPNRQGLDVALRGDAPAVGALTRYYGCFEDPPEDPGRSQAGQEVDYLANGALKVRGVELRQHSTPRVVRRAQEAALTSLAPAEDVAGFHARIPAALAAVRHVLDEVRAMRVPLDDLVFTNAIQQNLADYRANTLARSALAGLDAHGVKVAAGDFVRYVVLNADAREPRRRVAEVRLLRPGERYDVAHYEKVILRAIASLLLPFGWTEERLAAWFAGTAQARLAC